MVAVMLLAGCSGSEEGTANTAPIRAENAVATTTVPAPTTAVPVTTTSTTTSVARVDSVPTPVGEDYRVPIVVKFVPNTDVEREVLDAATELFVKYRALQLLVVSDRDQQSRALVGGALDEFVETVAQSRNDVTVPSKSDRVVIKAIETEPDTATVLVCEVDGSRVYVQSRIGDLVFDNDLLATLHKTYQLRQTAGGWRIAMVEVTAVTEGVDECAGS